MGGQTDPNDVHGAIFNLQKLTQLFKNVGLIDIKPWESDNADCSSLYISLNLQGSKPTVRRLKELEAAKLKKVCAIMSVPRLGFMDNFFCCVQALRPLDIHLSKTTGAFWGQCLEKGMLEAITRKPDAILTIDYDTIFTKDDVIALMDLLERRPEVDAVCGLQMHRTRKFPMLTIRSKGKMRMTVSLDDMQNELLQVSTAHFGLTLIRTKSLLDVPHPWFKGEPDSDGNWGDGKIDDDIWFWKQWEKCGKTIYQANRVPIGHAELMIMWPGHEGKKFKHIFQHPGDFSEGKRPEGLWK